MTTFITVVKYLNISNQLDGFLELIPGIRITNNKTIINDLITGEVQQLIGIIETNSIVNSNVVLYYQFEDQNFFEDLPNLESLNLILGWVDDILKNLWLIKDNCIVCDTGYLISARNETIEASSSKLSYILTSSTNSFDEITLSTVELNDFISYHHQIERYLHEKKSGSRGFMLEKTFSRISRSLLFVKQAREARNLAYKISNYCSAFESVFSTDSSELTYRLSERVAFFLCNDFEKLETFKLLKAAYVVRSRLTHGDELSPKQINQLPEIAKKVDELLRVTLNKILSDSSLTELFDSKKDNIDQYFEKIIFG